MYSPKRRDYHGTTRDADQAIHSPNRQAYRQSPSTPPHRPSIPPPHQGGHSTTPQRQTWVDRSERFFKVSLARSKAAAKRNQSSLRPHFEIFRPNPAPRAPRLPLPKTPSAKQHRRQRLTQFFPRQQVASSKPTPANTQQTERDIARSQCTRITAFFPPKPQLDRTHPSKKHPP
jgi:hypothetical protein